MLVSTQCLCTQYLRKFHQQHVLYIKSVVGMEATCTHIPWGKAESRKLPKTTPGHSRSVQQWQACKHVHTHTHTHTRTHTGIHTHIGIHTKSSTVVMVLPADAAWLINVESWWQDTHTHLRLDFDWGIAKDQGRFPIRFYVQHFWISWDSMFRH